MSGIHPLRSDGHIHSTEQHFRVSAGPGAGKTYWLARHVTRVVRESDRLGPASRVLCLSYTNVAVAELVAKLAGCGDRIEASTIHAFLYKHVLRPYAHLLENENGNPLLEHASIDGHDEHRPTYGKVKAWLEGAGVQQAARYRLLNQDFASTSAILKRARWWPQADGSWKLALPPGPPPKFFPSSRLDTYKPLYWAEGILDHDDVVYLSRMVLLRCPALGGFLAARFPYIFVDEFQDTHPAQTELLRLLAEAGAVVGVIGDVHQSIYGFQNARPEDFTGLSLPGLADYRVEQNRRSTHAIVGLLNAARKDGLVQTSLRGEAGQPVQVLVGAPEEALRTARDTLAAGQRLVSMCYTNQAAAALRRSGAGLSGTDPWAALNATDVERSRFLQRLLQASELVRDGQLALGVRKAMEALGLRRSRPFDPLSSRLPVDKIAAQGIALSLLECVNRLRGTTSVLEAYRLLEEALAAHPGIALRSVGAGAFRTAAASITLRQLRDALNTPEARSDFCTIHSAKGAEFENVAVFFPDAATLERCLDASQPDKEELRVHYVAMSRARDRLVLCLPDQPSAGLLDTLAGLGVEVVMPEAPKGQPLWKIQPSLFGE